MCWMAYWDSFTHWIGYVSVSILPVIRRLIQQKKRLFFSSRVRTNGKNSFGKHSNTRNSVKSNILSSNFPIFTQLLVCFNWSFNYVVHWQHQFWDWRWKHCDCGCNYICNCSNDHFKFVTFFHLMWAILPVPIFVTLLHFMAPSLSRLILLFACLALVITRTATIPKKQMTRSEQEAHWTLVWVKWNVTIVPVKTKQSSFLAREYSVYDEENNAKKYFAIFLDTDVRYATYYLEKLLDYLTGIKKNRINPLRAQRSFTALSTEN